MKKILLYLFLIICSGSFAQVHDTTTVVYNLNNLSLGNLNGQNSWSTTPYGVTTDAYVQDTNSFDGTKTFSYNRTGSGYGVDGSRAMDTIFSGIAFSDYSAKYVITYDVKRSYWGVDFGIGADLNNNGKVLKSETNEIALRIRTSSLNGENFLRPDGTSLTSTLMSGSWSQVEISLYNLNTTTSGKITVRERVLGTSNWVTLVNNQNLGIDTNSTGKKNPSLWDMMYIHFEGAGGYLDNFSFTKILGYTLVGVQEISSRDFEIFPNPVSNELFLNTVNGLRVQSYQVVSMDGRTVAEKKISQGTESLRIDVSNLAAGMYMLLAETEKGMVRRRFEKN